MSEQVFVTNMNPEYRDADPFTDSYAGIKYQFPYGKETVIPREAAHHIFGYGRVGKGDTVDDQVRDLIVQLTKFHLVRLGKNVRYSRTQDGREVVQDISREGLKWLTNFKIAEGKFVRVETKEDLNPPRSIPTGKFPVNNKADD